MTHTPSNKQMDLNKKKKSWYCYSFNKDLTICLLSIVGRYSLYDICCIIAPMIFLVSWKSRSLSQWGFISRSSKAILLCSLTQIVCMAAKALGDKREESTWLKEDVFRLVTSVEQSKIFRVPIRNRTSHLRIPRSESEYIYVLAKYMFLKRVAHTTVK